MKSTRSYKSLICSAIAILVLIGNYAFAQDTLDAASLPGDWKVCISADSSGVLDSTFECVSKTTYRFEKGGNYSIFYFDANAVSKEIETGNWRIVQGVLIMSSTRRDGSRPREDVIVAKMIDQKRFYELKQRFRKFANGSMKSYPSYTYFVRVE